MSSWCLNFMARFVRVLKAHSPRGGVTQMEEQRYLGRLEPGMDVCDLDGNKFGTIERAFRHDMASGATPESSTIGTMTREDILQVKTGLLGLGKHYYIPFSAIQDVTSGC